MLGPRERVVRARQRDRANSIPGFDAAFPPQPGEWGIDKLMLTVGGSWRAGHGNGFQLFEERFSDPDGPRWLGAVQSKRTSLSVRTLENIPLNVGSIHIAATGCDAQNGHLKIEARLNPTRTLSSLLVRHGNSDTFRADIFGMDEHQFFQPLAQHERLSPSLDGGDNFLPEQPRARDALGSDPFAVFLPIYLAQLRELLGNVLSANYQEMSFDSSEQVFLAQGGGAIRLNWADARVPQIESYFERFHPEAPAAVRRAAIAIIDGDQDSEVRSYPGPPTLGRSADCLSISTALNRRYELAIYAKATTRIRFEVRRLSRGRYGETRIPEGSAAGANLLDARLMHIIFDVERREASRLVRWGNVFRSFDEPNTPYLSDLTRLLVEIGRATGRTDEVFVLLLDRLLVDGGVSTDVDSRLPETVIRRLVQAGVLVRAHMRRPDPPGQNTRYRLADDYQWLRQRIHSALSPDQPEGA